MDPSVEEEKISSDASHLCSEAEISEEFRENLKIGDDSGDTVDVKEEENGGMDEFGEVDDAGEDDDDEEEEEEEEFSFMCGDANSSPIAAEDAFINGQIRPFFPFFSRDLVYSVGNSSVLHDTLPMRPPVEKVFVETIEGDDRGTAPENGEISGSHCDWSSRKAVEASPEVCRKSNSTGFSKIWRFKDFLGRSNSDGRDAFVFLSNSQEAEQPPPALVRGSEKAVGKESGVKVNAGKATRKKSKTAPLSAHEMYLKSKAKNEERHRSYLPYRPELMGFFTNVNGGLTKNVHPF